MTSSNFLPTIIIPTGKPSLKPALIDRAGCPVTFIGDVFGILSNALSRYSAKYIAKGYKHFMESPSELMAQLLISQKISFSQEMKNLSLEF